MMESTVTNRIHHPKQSASTSLCEHDLEVLTSRAISLEVATARGSRTVTAAEARSYGFPALAGLLIPSHDTAGDTRRYQLRPHAPLTDPDTGKPRKYLWAVGTRQSIDVPPASLDTLEDIETPIIITESALKADAILSAIEPGAFCVLAVAGVYGWRSQDMPLSDHKDIPWKLREGKRIRKRRRVYLAFDSDASTNANVARARYDYADYLRRNRKADVHYIDVPSDADGGKQGIDDALAAGHNLETMLASSYRAPEAPPAIGDDPAGDAARVSEVDRLRQRVAALEEELAEAHALQSATMRLLKNPELKDKEKMVYANIVTLAAHKQRRGETESDGRIVLEPRHIANDHRPIPARGESRLERNPLDDSKPITARSNVVKLAETACEAGIFEELEVRHVAKQGDDGRWAKYPEIVIRPEPPLAAIARLADYVPADRAPRKAYTWQEPCPHCGEVHSRTRRTYCNGCGAETEPPKILPVPEAQQPGTAGDDAPAESPDIAADASSTKNVMVKDGPPSGTPTYIESTKKVMPDPEPDTPAESSRTKNVRPPIREELEQRTRAAEPPPPSPAGPLFDDPAGQPEGHVCCEPGCGAPLPPGRKWLCEPCAAEGERRNAERWKRHARAS